MAFRRKAMQYPVSSPLSQREYLIAECSRGLGRIFRDATDGLTGKTLSWRWEVTYSMKMANKSVVKKSKSGLSNSLLKAAQVVLQCLLSQKKRPIYEMMSMLNDNQAMFALSKIGS